MNSQDETAFAEFLQPIANLDWRIAGIMSDKQRALLLAVASVFPGVPHGFCQFYYLDNAAEPIAAADEQMKIELRQGVRSEVGDLIRHKQAEKRPIPVVTGLLPSPTPTVSTPIEPEMRAEQERERIVQDLLARVRYLLTLLYFSKLIEQSRCGIFNANTANEANLRMFSKPIRAIRVGFFIARFNC